LILGASHALQDANLYVVQDNAAARSHAIVENNPLTIAHLVTINILTHTDGFKEHAVWRRGGDMKIIPVYVV
jgi:hypothetical protein